MAASWGRGILETHTDPRLLGEALGKLTNRPYPPDLGALLAEVATTAITDDEAMNMLRRAAREARSTSPAWHTLTRLECAAARLFGAHELRQAGARDLPRWQSILSSLRGQDLPPQGQVSGQLEHRIDHSAGLALLRSWAAQNLK